MIEFILCIILKCDNSEELIQSFLNIPESSAEDMQHLIEGANIQMTEAAESVNDYQASFMNTASFKAGVAKQLEDSENRRHQLEVQMI